MVALAAERWNSDQPQTVTLKNRKLDDATIRPVWHWSLVVCLDLSGNDLRVLPENINLPNIKNFDVSYNNIQKLPTQLHLPSLSSLDISHNRLRDVAAAMMQLCGSYNLTSIGLKGNNLIVPPPKIIERGGKSVWQYFKFLSQVRCGIDCAHALF